MHLISIYTTAHLCRSYSQHAPHFHIHDCTSLPQLFITCTSFPYTRLHISAAAIHNMHLISIYTTAHLCRSYSQHAHHFHIHDCTSLPQLFTTCTSFPYTRLHISAAAIHNMHIISIYTTAHLCRSYSQHAHHFHIHDCTSLPQLFTTCTSFTYTQLPDNKYMFEMLC